MDLTNAQKTYLKNAEEVCQRKGPFKPRDLLRHMEAKGFYTNSGSVCAMLRILVEQGRLCRVGYAQYALASPPAVDAKAVFRELIEAGESLLKRMDGIPSFGAVAVDGRALETFAFALAEAAKTMPLAGD